MIGRKKLSLICYVLGIVPASAAAEPSLVGWVEQQVQSQLVKPLAEQRIGFSRRRPPPRESRVRVLQATSSRDEQDREFVPFAVDIRSGSEWREDITGCIYRADAKIFVKHGDTYRPATFMLGKNAEAVADVCKPVAPKARS